ncbi:hypothetical protein GAMM_200025 [Gammaproteobacteria bacterium]
MTHTLDVYSIIVISRHKKSKGVLNIWLNSIGQVLIYASYLE